jgi:hypothetical protein
MTNGFPRKSRRYFLIGTNMGIFMNLSSVLSALSKGTPSDSAERTED